jgi:cytochrome c556
VALAGAMMTLFTGSHTLTQETAKAPVAAASDGAMTTLTPAEDAVVARRLLMVSIGANNDAVHDILDGARPMDEYEMQTRLNSISHMLYAFPHLYRAKPDPWTQERADKDAARVSLATEAVWTNFAAFETMAHEAYVLAQRAADAPKADVLSLVEELEGACEACHTRFRKEFKYLDYDDLDASLNP